MIDMTFNPINLIMSLYKLTFIISLNYFKIQCCINTIICISDRELKYDISYWCSFWYVHRTAIKLFECWSIVVDVLNNDRYLGKARKRIDLLHLGWPYLDFANQFFSIYVLLEWRVKNFLPNISLPRI